MNDGVELYLSRNAGNLKYPFDDAVMNVSLARNWGIRRRVNLAPVYPEGVSREDLSTVEKMDAYKKAFDKLVVKETLMESAGEAKAYFAMMRVADRWNDPAILADLVAQKYTAGQANQIHQYLLNRKNWFVQYPLE